MGAFDETAIIDYIDRLPTKENKVSFFVSVFSKQTEVCHYHFSVCSKQTEVAVFRWSVFCRYINTENGPLYM
jgi:hypothetical protein